MKQKKIAIIGASYLQYPLVEKAKKMGIKTHCFAWEEGAVCKNIADFFYPISITEKEEILAKCKKINIDGIVSIASDLAVSTVCYVAQKMNLISNQLETINYTTDKYEMRKKLGEANIVIPKFTHKTDIESLKELNFPIIVKPTDRSGSRGITKVNNKYELSTAIERANQESFDRNIIIEEFIEGLEVSVETISWKGKHFILAITDKVTTGAPYFVELEHHQPSSLPDKVTEKIKIETIRILNALNIEYGASHTELKITKKGEIYTIEVGARMGGDFIGSNLVKLSTGYDFLRGTIEVALGDFQTPTFRYKKFSGVYFLNKSTKHLLKVIEEKEKYPSIIKAEISNDKLSEAKQSADRSGYFIYQSNSKISF